MEYDIPILIFKKTAFVCFMFYNYIKCTFYSKNIVFKLKKNALAAKRLF